MPKVEWGKKLVCTSCEVKFYDLNRKYPLSCPSCGFEVEENIDNEIPSEARKVFSDDVENVADVNLVGSDATESIATEDEIAIEEVDVEETISLEEADQDVDVIDSEVDELTIEQSSDQADED